MKRSEKGGRSLAWRWRGLISGLVIGSALLAAQQIVKAANARPAESLPFAESAYVRADTPEAYAAAMMSGGPPPDGIPAIDEPRFVPAAQADLEGGDIVMGFAHNGEARAYPQRIMVWHEIVNDRVGGLNVAVTYCPLTATAQGFKRGDTTLGVSGRLLNSNMVMFDRETRSYFSQIPALGIQGDHIHRTLDEVNVIWTTWERWVAAYPETTVLSERTGHLRNYQRDPYGSYNPAGGYYTQAGTIFPLMHESGRHHEKTMVVGGRTSQASAYFVLEELAEAGVQATDSFLAVYDGVLDTGYIYVTGRDSPVVVPADEGKYRLEGALYSADELPLTPVVPVEGFYFAWHTFYPNSEFVSEGTTAPGVE
ncbi:MAG: DUF3179 domain-containing protein [Gemmatimonadota bacterium]